MENNTIAFVVRGTNGTGVLHQLTGVIARHGGDISQVEQSLRRFPRDSAAAKAGCPISRLLNTTITMEAKLVG